MTATESNNEAQTAPGQAELARPGWHIADGTARVFLAEMLIMPVGLIIAAFLTRRFGPGQYGLFTSAMALTAWLQWTICIMYSRATVKAVSDATGQGRDWRPVAVTAIQQQLLTSVATAAALCILAEPIAAMFHKPAVAGYLRLFSLDIPLFVLASAHRDVLIGTGRFRRRALASIGRWSARLFLVIGLVWGGLWITGAILGSIGASLVDLAICRSQLDLPLRRWWQRSTFPARQLWAYVGPLFAAAVGVRLYDRLDLFAIQVMGGSDEQTGWYGAAQNLALLPSIFALSFTPLLLSTLTRLLHSGRQESARQMAQHAVQLVVCLFPLGGIVAGSADAIVVLVSGTEFLPAGQILAWLMFAALCCVMISTGVVMLIAAGRASWTVMLCGGLPIVALIGHVTLFPRYGPVGAAVSSTIAAALGAAIALAVVWKLWRVAPSLATLCRSAGLCIGMYFVSQHWNTHGVMLLIEMTALAILVAAAFFLSGEFRIPYRDQRSRLYSA